MPPTNTTAEKSFFVYVKDTLTGVIKKLVIPSSLQVGIKGKPSELQVFGRLTLTATHVQAIEAYLSTRYNIV